MAIPDKDWKLLCQRSGNRCAFTDCRDLLTASSTSVDGVAVLGHVAHIVGQSRRGPRGEIDLEPDARDVYSNLILVCSRHHKLIDSQPQTYTAVALIAMKEAHEQWVETTLGRGVSDPSPRARPMVIDTLHSNLMRVERMPHFVYSAPCTLADAEIVAEAKWPTSPLMAPWTLRGSRLYAFQDLREEDSPFASVVQRSETERHALADWFDDPDATNRFLAMGNRAINSMCRRRHLSYDHNHKRFFFAPQEAGKERSITYKSVRGRVARKRVVYQPRSKKHGTALSFWIHWALRLRLIQIAADQFVLSFTPDLRVTRDGENELPPELVGEKVTRRKTRWYNFETLSHVHFWRDYLSEGKPRITLPFGPSSALVVNTTLIQARVTWPGIPAEFAKAFTNIDYQDDLFSMI
ncbi:MAG TPA: hypothetical protein VF221_21405, partial [Chloroflexota bacterium]